MASLENGIKIVKMEKKKSEKLVPRRLGFKSKPVYDH